VLDAPVDWGLIKALGPKAAVVYNPSDPWFQHYQEMHKALPGIEVRHALLSASMVKARVGLLHAHCHYLQLAAQCATKHVVSL
jgi:hypothetical protein